MVKKRFPPAALRAIWAKRDEKTKHIISVEEQRQIEHKAKLAATRGLTNRELRQKNKASRTINVVGKDKASTVPQKKISNPNR